MNETSKIFKLKTQIEADFSGFIADYTNCYNRVEMETFAELIQYCTAAAYSDPIKFELETIKQYGLCSKYFWGFYYVDNLNLIAGYKLHFQNDVKSALLWAGKFLDVLHLFWPASCKDYISNKVTNFEAVDIWRKYSDYVFDEYGYSKLKLGWENDPILSKPDVVGKAITFGRINDYMD